MGRARSASVAKRLPARTSLRADLVKERRRVERLESDPPGDLLARRLRALAEERAEELAGSWAAPPLLADRCDQVAPQLGRADPGAEVVGRVEARIHVGDVGVAAVPDARRLGEELLVPLGGAAVVR